MMSFPARNASYPELVTRSWRKFLAAVIVCACIPAPAQILKTGPEGSSQKLFITVLEGEGALNNIRERDAREPVVQVTDENHKPVSGALVLFLIHDGGHGAGATFDGGQTFTATTGPDGIARTSGLQVDRNPGSYTIAVSASLGAVVAEQVIIHQSNVITALSSTTSASTSATSGGSNTATTVATHGILHMSKTVAIVAGSAVVAGVVAGVVVATHGSSSTTLTLGASTVGHP
jgi:hypothetical protein